MADPHYHETHNKVELAFELATLPPHRIAVHWVKGKRTKRGEEAKLFGDCLRSVAEDVMPLGWYDVHRRAHFVSGTCAHCGRPAKVHSHQN